MRDENHQVSRVDVRGCGSRNVRRCCEEWDNLAAPDQARRLTIEWTAAL